MTLFRTVDPQHTYRKWLQVAAKTVAKYLCQNQTINTEILKNHSIKIGTQLTMWTMMNFLKSSRKEY